MYDKIPENFQRNIVKIFMDNGYFEQGDTPIYFFTKIPDRAKHVYAFRNFTGGTEMEMAFDKYYQYIVEDVIQVKENDER